MAITGRIKIEKEFVLKAYRRKNRWGGLFHVGYHLAIRLMFVWLAIASADACAGRRDLAALHALTIFFVWIVATVCYYVSWYQSLKKTVVGWEFDATLDDEGVKTHSIVDADREVPWSFYKGYREHDGYLEIHDQKDQVTFVPKTEELADLVVFTKEKIPRL